MCWALSYPAMSCSNLLWLKLDGSRALFSKKQTLAPLTGTSLALMTSHVFVSLVIVVGSAWCFFTIPHFDGRSDDCPAIIGSAPVCDSVVFYGELAYFVTWFLTFAYITVKHPPHSRLSEFLEILQTIFLLGGPVQILIVYNILPFTPLWDGSGAELSEMLGTAVSYKVCVCANHVTVFLISSLMLTKPDKKHKA